MAEPLVSIVTPVLNGRKYLDEYLRSVLEQSYPHIEQVFVDGGSTDGTLEALRAYQTSHPHRIRIISEAGSGPGQAWITGIKVAEGDILGCLGADDVCEPGAIEAVADFFRANLQAFFVHGGAYFIDEGGAIVRRHEALPFRLQDLVGTSLQIATISAFYRRAVPELVGWLESEGDDFELMILIARHYEMHSLPRVLSRLRLRKDSAFNPTDFEQRRKIYRQTYRVSRRYGGSLHSPLAIRYFATEAIAWLGLRRFFPAIRVGYRTLRGRPGA